MQVKRYLLNLAIAVDQLLNVMLFGDPDETLSSRAYRNRNKSKFWSFMRILVDSLFFWQDQHCKKAYMSEVLRKHLAKDFNNY